MAIREKKLVIDSQIADALLSGLDKMKLMVDAWGSDRGEYGHDQETAALTALLQDDGRKKEKIIPEKRSESTGFSG